MKPKKKLSASSQHGQQRRVKNGDITISADTLKEIEKLKHRKINLSDPDAPEITEWGKASVRKFYRPIKKQITIRVDADVLDWFKHAAKKYQSLMNQACRAYMEQHLSRSKAAHTKKKSA